MLGNHVVGNDSFDGNGGTGAGNTTAVINNNFIAGNNTGNLNGSYSCR